jgi:hypothetical protein
LSHLDIPRFHLERALLALRDPAGEVDAVAPLSRSRARATVENAIRHVDPTKSLAALEADGDLWVSYYQTPKGVTPYYSRPREIVQAALRPRRRPLLRVYAGGRIEPSAILAALKVDPLADYGMVSCPLHQDEHPSLSWRRTPERVLLHCFSQQCAYEDIVAGLGLAS